MYTMYMCVFECVCVDKSVCVSVCVCVCAFVSRVNRGGQLVCTRLHTGESGRHSETVEPHIFILP